MMAEACLFGATPGAHEGLLSRRGSLSGMSRWSFSLCTGDSFSLICVLGPFTIKNKPTACRGYSLNSISIPLPIRKPVRQVARLA